MALVVKTIGSAGGRDYSTIVAWVAALPANLVTDGNSYEGDCYNDAIFDDGQILIGGNTTDATHTITLTTGAGQSFRDKSNAQSNALNYNQANGVALTRSVGGSSTVIVSDDFVTLSGLQIRHTAGASGGALRGSAGVANQHFIMTNCILNSDTTNASICTFDDGTILRNCLFVRLAQGTSAGVIANEGSVNQTINVYFCDIVAPSDISAPASALLIQAAGSTFVTENCAFFGCTAVNGASGGTYTHTTGMSDVASPPTGVTGSKTYGNQFQNTTTASGDYRLKPGADLRGAATADATNGATDILGTQRPQLMRWDIGAMEFPQPYVDAEFPGLPKRRRPWRVGAEPNELLFNPTQTVFARWGFDEPRQREPQPTRRKAWRAGAQPADNEGLPFTAVVTPTRFYEEEAHRIKLRREWRAFPWPVDHEGFPFTAQTPTSYYEEELHRIELRRAWRAPGQAADNEGLPFTATVTPTRYYEEEPHVIERRRPWRAYARPADNEGLPFTAVTPTAYYEEEAHRVELRRSWRAPASPADNEGLPFTAVVTPTQYYEEEGHRLKLRRPWLSYPKPADNEGLLFTAVTSAAYPEEEIHRRPVRLPIHLNQTVPDEFLLNPTQAVFVSWGYDEPPFQRIVRRSWRSFPRQEAIDDIGAVKLVGVPWGFDEPPFQHVVRNRWFSREQPDNVDIGVVQLVGAPWFDEPPVTLRRRLSVPRSIKDEFLRFTSVIVPSTWADIDWWQHPERLAWHAHPQPNDIEGLRFTSVITPLVWSDIDRDVPPRRRVVVPHSALDEFLPFTAGPSLVWGDIEEWHRVRRAAARIAQASGDITEVGPIAPSSVTWFPDEFRRVPPRLITPRSSEELIIPGAAAVALAWGWEGDLSSRIRRATRPQSRADEVFPAPLILPQPWADPDQQHLRPQSSSPSLWRSRVIWQYPWEGWPFIPPIPPIPPIPERFLPWPLPDYYGLVTIDLTDYIDGPVAEVLAFQSLPQWHGEDGSSTFVAVTRPVAYRQLSGDRRAVTFRILAGYSVPIRLKLEVITVAGKRYRLRTR